MTELSKLKRFDLIYVSTPYSKYPRGIEAAFIDSCRILARLIRAGLNVYGPIPHAHPIAIHGDLDPLDHTIWLPFDSFLMNKSEALLVAMLDGWETSRGVRHEIEAFALAKKPVFFMSAVDLSYAPKVTA